MNNNCCTFIFIRHAESEKNLRDITGGEGEHLTNKGELDAIAFSEKLANRLDLSKHYSVTSSNTPQTIDTGIQITKKLNTELIISDELYPAGFGIAGGLSNSQIEEKFPTISERLNSWRNRDIEAIDLQIPGMESPVEFWNRIICYLTKFETNSNNIIVCTRSVMVLIANLVSGKQPYRGGGYRHVKIEHCSIIAFKLIFKQNKLIDCNDITVELLPDLTTIDLRGFL